MPAADSQLSSRSKRLVVRLGYTLLLVLLLTGVIGGVIRMLGLERRFIYFPSRDVHTTPAAFSLHAEELRVRTPDGETVHGWWLRKDPGTRSARLTLLLSHGNAGTIADRLHRVAQLQRHLDVDFVLYDYRGYGHSSGSPDEQGTYRDSRAVYDWLVARGVPPNRIVLFGESLGCAVSVQLALDRRAHGLILEAPFSSIRAMAQVALPWLPVGALLRTRYDNEAKIAGATIPLLVFHGTEDEVIPFAQGEAVFRAAREPKRLFPVVGAHHNDVYLVGGSDYVRALADFLSSLPP